MPTLKHEGGGTGLKNTAIDKIGVFVSNYKNALAFYKELLKLHVVWESEEGKNAGFRVGANLIIIQESGKEVKPGGIRVYFTVGNIESLRDEMIKNHITCSELLCLDDFKLLNFTDEDGNRFGLMEPSQHYIPLLEEYLDRKLLLNKE
jgi:predicted enzyme related to lactoylglutathione lyase